MWVADAEGIAAVTMRRVGSELGVEAMSLYHHIDGREAGTPPVKETREVWWTDGFVPTHVYEMDDVRNGHTIEGPAVLEAESTTFPIPPDRRAWLDEHGIFHLENKEA